MSALTQRMVELPPPRRKRVDERGGVDELDPAAPLAPLRGVTVREHPDAGGDAGIAWASTTRPGVAADSGEQL